jgi:predicted GTPase
MPSDNATDYTDDNLPNKLEEGNMQSVNKLGKCNILVIGKTGVGKSTLINAVFREDVAKIGVGKRITESIQKYHKEVSLITIYDTPGLQLFSGEEIANFRHEASRLIKTEPIHVVWYCINAKSNRWEKIEEDWIRDIARQKVPIILILTNSLSDNDSEFLDYLKKQELPIVDVIPVLALPLQITSAYTIKVWGLENLVELTASTLPEVAKKAFIEAILAQQVITERKDKNRWKNSAMMTDNNTNYSNEQLLDIFNKQYESFAKDIGQCNILLLGKTGVGKSTLVNAVFEEKLALTGTGKSITQNIKQHRKPSYPITIYDTPGLELTGQVIQRLKDEVAKLIDDQRKLSTENHIHVVWFCINEQSSRFEDAEEEWIKDIVEREVPVIIVLTQTYNPKRSKLLDFIKERNLLVNDVIPVLAEPVQITNDITIPTHGLEHLVQVTASRLPEVARKAFIREQKVNLDLKISEAEKCLMRYYVPGSAAAGTPLFLGSLTVPAVAFAQIGMVAHLTYLCGLPFNNFSFLWPILLACASISIPASIAASKPSVSWFRFGAAGGTTLLIGKALLFGYKQYLTAQIDGHEIPVTELKNIIIDKCKEYSKKPATWAVVS